MPSFDIVSEIDMHELSNSIDQANREITNRFDFKGTNSRVELKENIITLVAPAEFQIKQIEDILTTKMSKRGIDIKCLEKGEVTENINEARKAITVHQGIDKELAKKLVKLVKDTKLKVQSSIQGEQVRVTGKKRDDLQEIIQMLKNSKLDLPLQFVNFRD
ncbi:MAG: YajQ family cyclic di-GMP-binding protein [Gammaproteobacteria bacterium]|jgi:uncharacterized protein YajQ (UPF0234 family)